MIRHRLRDLLVLHVTERVESLGREQLLGQVRLAHRLQHHAGEYRLELKSIADIGLVMSISRHTVGDHVKNIYRKLEISSRAEATMHARNLGLV